MSICTPSLCVYVCGVRVHVWCVCGVYVVCMCVVCVCTCGGAAT